MSIRIELKEGFNRSEVYQWMTRHIGPMCDEGDNKTWFWSTGDITKKMNHYGQWEDTVGPEGIRIWKDCPATAIAILKFS